MFLSSIKNFLFYFKIYLFRNKEFHFFKELSQNIKLNPEELSEKQNEKFLKLFRYTWDNNSFYRKKWSDYGINKGDIKSISDISLLPILTKREIRSNLTNMISDGYKLSCLDVATTGGTTGEPLKVYRSKSVVPLSWRMLNFWGLSPYSNSAYLYRNVPNQFVQLLHKIFLFPNRREWISAKNMSDVKIKSFHDKVVKNNTEYLVGYVGSILRYAEFIEKNNLNIKSLKLIWTTASPLSYLNKKYLQKVFKINEIYSQYGSCEFYSIAAECKCQKGLKIFNDSRHVEVVDEAFNSLGNNVIGNLIITDLEDFAFPIIRYKIGDKSRILDDNCSCDLPFPSMDYVKGRETDFIYTKSGKKIPGEYWTTIFDDFVEEIKIFKIHQKQDYSVDIIYELNTGIFLFDIKLGKIKKDIIQILGNDIEVNFLQQTINVNENGKYNFIKSEFK